MVRGLAVSEPLVVPCSAAVTTILVGFQHYLVMLGTTVLIATIIVPLMGGGHVCEPDCLTSFFSIPLHFVCPAGPVEGRTLIDGRMHAV
jgi:hypothetical protein